MQLYSYTILFAFYTYNLICVTARLPQILNQLLSHQVSSWEAKGATRLASAVQVGIWPWYEKVDISAHDIGSLV